MEAWAVRGEGRQRPDPGHRAETQLARLDGGGTGWLWCCGMGEPWENSEQEN